jgi:hypothetical protein
VSTFFRFVDYVIRGDDLGLRTWGATCVAGDSEDCGASAPGGDQEAVSKWMAEHCRETGHTRFQRQYEDFATVERRVSE